MPEMDGFELLTHMQEDERLKEIPVVIMSANDD
jgi:CheY-like chemotaxis protein